MEGSGMTEIVISKEPYRILPEVYDLSTKLANTEFVPAGLRGKPAAIAACVLAGRELGIGPMSSLQNIIVIDGRPSMTALLMRQLILAAGHSIHYAESTDFRCIVKGRRRGEEDWTTIVWTMDQAKKAGLDGKMNWRKYPKQMLQARATGELARLAFADCLGGMGYLEDEISEVDTAEVVSMEDRKSKRTMRRGSVPTIIPNLPDTDDDEDGDLPVPDEIIIPDTIPLTETINLSDPFTGELIDIKDEK
jgi:hypothetical protein